MIQLSSRGRRKAPVKNTRARWITIAATKMQRRPVVHLAHDQAGPDVEAQVHGRVERLGHLHALQRLVAALVESRRVLDASKKKVRYTPVATSTTKSRGRSRPAGTTSGWGRPCRASSGRLGRCPGGRPPTAQPGRRDSRSAALIVPRSQKPGPTGSGSRLGHEEARRRRWPAAAGAATGWPDRRPAAPRQSRRRSTGGTGTAAARLLLEQPHRAARVGAHLRVGDRVPPGVQSSRPGRGSIRSSPSRMSTVWAVSSPTWPSGKTVMHAVRPRASRRDRVALLGDQPEAAGATGWSSGHGRDGARASGSGTGPPPRGLRRPRQASASGSLRRSNVVPPASKSADERRRPRPRWTRLRPRSSTTCSVGMKRFAHSTMPRPMPPRATNRSTPSAWVWPPTEYTTASATAAAMLATKHAAGRSSCRRSGGFIARAHAVMKRTMISERR